MVDAAKMVVIANVMIMKYGEDLRLDEKFQNMVKDLEKQLRARFETLYEREKDVLSFLELFMFAL